MMTFLKKLFAYCSHDWEVYDSWECFKIRYASVVLGRRELGRVPVTMIYSKCSECGQRKSELVGGWNVLPEKHEQQPL